jgi:hypothetical protein
MLQVKQSRKRGNPMASYTMQLREYIEMWSQDETLSTKDIIEKGRPKLFDFEYPIFDPDYKKVFETHFIRKFYMREIGFETEGLFKFQLETWLSINMPYFNKLFESELLTFDPLSNTKLDVTKNKTNDVKKNDTRDSTQTSTSDGSSTNTSTQSVDGTLTEDIFDRQLESNNPDTRLALTANDGEGVIEYASSIKENSENNKKTSSSDTSGTAKDITKVDSEATAKDTLSSEVNETEDFIEKRLGKVGSQSYSKMLEEYRNTYLRIENKIFNEMQELFMLVY